MSRGFSNTNIDLLYVTTGDNETASTRHRVLDVIPHLDRRINTDILSYKSWRQAPSRRKITMKSSFVLSLMRRAIKSDVIYIQKLPLPRSIIKILSLLCEEIIFDFDDAIYISQSGQEKPRVMRWLNACLDCSSLVITGNPNLSKYAKKYNENVKTMPTPVPKVELPVNDNSQEKNRTTIGWIGHPSNLSYLRQIKGPLTSILTSNKAELRIVTDVGRKYEGPFEDLIGETVIYDQWELNSENKKISEFDFSVRPIPNTQWNRAKGGYTSIVRCISLGIPVISSSLETLKEILPPGGPILFTDSLSEWSRMMEILTKYITFRHKLAGECRNYIDKQGLWAENFASDISREIQKMCWN